MHGYVNKDATSNRNLQSLTCRVLLAQKACLDLFINFMESDATSWPVAVRQSIKEVTASHNTIRANLGFDYLCQQLSEDFFGRFPTEPIMAHINIHCPPNMIWFSWEVWRKLSAGDETWRAGWPESAERFWQLVKVSCLSKHACFAIFIRILLFIL